MNEQACNPFSTRFTRPGALLFQLDEGEDASHVVGRLRQHNWFGQIVGPHGSGKSTLLATLRPALEAAGREPQVVQLRQAVRLRRWTAGQPGRLFYESQVRSAITQFLFGGGRSPLDQLPWRQFSVATQVVVDGYEQLGPLARRLIVRRCRRRGCGLLVTTHHDAGLPTIYSTRPRLELALALVRRLAPTADVISDGDIEAAWHAQRGDVREMLFHLYDLFEQRRPTDA